MANCTVPRHEQQSKLIKVNMLAIMACTDACWEPDSDCLLEDDPTLADCCRRDMEEQKHVQHIKKALLSHDRTDMRTKVAHNAFLRDPNDEAAAAAGLREEDIDSLITDSDEDAGAKSPHNLSSGRL